jgi:IS5 family transposase
MSEGRQFKAKKSITNWAEYEAGLVKRYDISIYVADESVFDKPEPTGEGGRPKEYSDGYIELGLTLKSVYRMPYRGLEGFVTGVLRLNGMGEKPVPDFTTFCNRAKVLEIESKLAALRGKKIDILVDSTGLKIFGEGEWKMKIHGKTKRRTWRKLHLGVDEATQLIVVGDLTLNSTGDQEHLPDLLDDLPEDIDLNSVTADGIYDTWDCYGAANDHGATIIVPPRKNAVEPDETTGRADHPRSQAIRDCERLGREEWKKATGYHRRSLAETAMYRYKTSFGEKMFSREFNRQKTEAHIKIKTLNLFRTLATPHYDQPPAA